MIGETKEENILSYVFLGTGNLFKSFTFSSTLSAKTIIIFSENFKIYIIPEPEQFTAI